MRSIATYPTQVEADVDRLLLEAAGIDAVVVGIATAMDGGIAGVRLLVRDEVAARASAILARSRADRPGACADRSTLLD